MLSMLRFMTPVAMLALTVSLMPIGARAQTPIAGAAPLAADRLAAVTAMPVATPIVLDDLAEPVRSTAREQTDVWMSEQGVRYILDAARPVVASVAVRR